jgi:hypothetical protein
MIVVLDTNIWLQEMGLNSATGAATRFFIRKHNATIAIPEVVRLEAEDHLRQSIHAAIYRIRDEHSKLLTLFGTLLEVSLPSEAEVGQKVSQLLSDTGVETATIEFSLQSARSSFLKILARQPPNSPNSQQFKDGVLWADCLSLLQGDDVSFVTSDKAFFLNRNFSEGIAPNLAAEAAACPHALKIFSSLDGLLEDIKVKVDLDEDAFTSAYMNLHSQGMEKLLVSQGLARHERTNLSRNLYITEDPDSLSFDYTASYETVDISELGRSGLVLELKGDGMHNTRTNVYSQLRNLGESIVERQRDGTQKRTVINHYLYAQGITIGPTEIVRTVRVPLAEP